MRTVKTCFGVGISILVAALAIVALSGTAQAQYQGVGGITISNPNPRPCETVTISVTNMPPNTPVTVTANGVVVVTGTTDASGNFTTPYTVPCDAVGTITLAASAGGVTVTAVLNITSGGGGNLPRTGASETTSAFARVGALLLVAGAGMVLSTWLVRRRSARIVAP